MILKDFLDDSENIETNFREYLNSFSENVQDILENFDFDREISKLASSGMLFFNNKRNLISRLHIWVQIKLHLLIWDIFLKDLVRRFSESYDEQAGAHFTSRDIIYLMTDLLVAERKRVFLQMDLLQKLYMI